MSTALIVAATVAFTYSWSADAPAASAAPMQQEAAGSEYFLKLDGIDGDSEVKAGHVEVLSYSFGVSQAGAFGHGGGGGAGKVVLNDFVFMKRVSKASPKLYEVCANGTHIKEAKLTVRKQGGDPQEYMVVTFHDAMISSYQVSGSSGEPVPTEQVSLNYTKIEYEFFPDRSDGTVGEPVRSQYDSKKRRGG